MTLLPPRQHVQVLGDRRLCRGRVGPEQHDELAHLRVMMQKTAPLHPFDRGLRRSIAASHVGFQHSIGLLRIHRSKPLHGA